MDYIAHQAPLSMGFPRQEYWSGLSFPSPRDLSNPGIKPESPALAGGFFTTEPPRKPPNFQIMEHNKWTTEIMSGGCTFSVENQEKTYDHNWLGGDRQSKIF